MEPEVVLNTHLTSAQASFVLMLERQPKMLNLFDFDECIILPEILDQYLTVASHAEATMAKFYIAVWQNESFDMIDAAKTLNRTQINIITDWLQAPFFP